MDNDEKEKTASAERYTIFHALLEAMNEKEQKKSKWNRLLHRLGFNK